MSALYAVVFIFNFQSSLLFFHIGRQAAQRRTQWHIKRCGKFGKYVYYTPRAAQGKLF